MPPRWKLVPALALSVSTAAHAIDFTGEGIADVLRRDSAQNDFRIRLSIMNGSTPGAISSSLSHQLAEGDGRALGFDVRSADFNGDGRSDLLTRDLATRALRIRLMNGTSVISSRTLTELATASASNLIAVADFDGDDRSDLLLRDPLSGGWSVQLVSGTAVRVLESGLTSVASAAAFQWVSSADFDGDGRADLLLRNTDSLAWRLHLMNGRTIRSTVTIANLPQDTDWQLQSVVDMNGDGQADLLMRNRDTGNWHCYFMNGGQILPTSGSAGIYSNLAFALEQIGDLNGDGHKDVLLRNASNGSWYVNYLMGRSLLAGSGTVAMPSSRAWRATDISDFTGDRVAEALVLDRQSGWKLIGIENRLQPEITPVGLSNATYGSTVCAPPMYYQYGAPDKPLNAPANSAFLTWSVPVTRVNGEALCADELSGYTLYSYGRNRRTTTRTDIASGRADSWLVSSLAADTYEFSIYAVDANGLISSSSAKALKTISP